MDRKELSTKIEKIIKDVMDATENMLQLSKEAQTSGFDEASILLRVIFYGLREDVVRLDDPAILD